MVSNRVLNLTDPFGLKECAITIYAGHNYNVKEMCNSDYPDVFDDAEAEIPSGHCIIGVGCGSGIDVDGDGRPDSLQDFIEEFYPCNSVQIPDLKNLDNPLDGLKFAVACKKLRHAQNKAKAAAKRMCRGQPSNPTKCKERGPRCKAVTIKVRCDEAMRRISNGQHPDNPTIPIPDYWWLFNGQPHCQICDSEETIKCGK